MTRPCPGLLLLPRQLLLIVPILIGLGSCCDKTIESVEKSPSGNIVAVVAYQNCGVLSAGTSVVLRAAKRYFWSQDAVVLGAEGRHIITVLWKDEHTLGIYLPHSLRERDFVDQKIAQRNENVRGVHIVYHQL